MSGPRVVSGTRGAADLGTWDRWIEVLEAAIAEYDRQLAGPPGATGAPVFTQVPVPAGAGTLPEALVPRTRAALDGLAQLTLRTQERRDGVAAQLSALSRVRGHALADRSHELGQAFDVSG